MIERYASSLGLVKGARVTEYDSVDELDNASGIRGTCLSLANKYLVEKGCLVDFRDKFTTALEALTGFKMLVKVTEKKKADDTVEQEETPSETEVQYTARFRKAVMDGSFSHDLFPKDRLEDALQQFADTLGTFPADSKKPERISKAKKPPKWIIERVTTIFANGTAKQWWEKMVKENIPIASWVDGDEAKNKLSLAWAIKERQARWEAEQAKQYA